MTQEYTDASTEMPPLELKIALKTYPHTRPLKDSPRLRTDGAPPGV